MSDVTLPTATPAATKRRGKTAAAPKRPLPPLDPKCPPRFVRQKATGVVTAWSGLFRDQIGEFEPFYREGTDEEVEHRLALRRYEAREVYEGRRPFDDSDFTSFGEEIDHDDGDADA